MAQLTNLCDRIARSRWTFALTGIVLPLAFVCQQAAFMYQYWVELQRAELHIGACFTLALALLIPVATAVVLFLGRAKEKPVTWRSFSWQIVFAAMLVPSMIFNESSSAMPFAPTDRWLTAMAALSGIVFHAGLFIASRSPEQKWCGIQWKLLNTLLVFLAAGFSVLFLPVIFLGICALLAGLLQIHPGFFSAYEEILPFVFTSGGILIALFFLFLFLRVVVMAADFLTARYKESKGFLFFIRLAAVWLLPFAGLGINTMIPFPMDCSSPWYLGLTFLTGLVLIIPAQRSSSAGVRWVFWFARWLFFPFTLYFFLLFLPFLPLGLPGMLYLGAGLLLFAPAFLMLVHSQLLIDDFHALRRNARLAPLVLTALLAFSAMPGAITARALFHRAVLHEMTETLLNTDSSLMNRPPLRYPGVARYVLKEAYAFNYGVYVPGLSPFYRWIVFDNLTLPNDRLTALWKIVDGGGIPLAPKADWGMFTRVRNPRRFEAQPVTVGVVARHAEMTRTPGSADDELTLHLTIENTNINTGSPCGYVGTVTLPPAAFVTGLSLNIDGRWEPGRLFERTAAEWVYQRLTTQAAPLDPALLTATETPGRYTLQVFPVLTTREVRLTLVVPSGCSEEIRIDELTVGGETAAEEPVFYTAPGVLATTAAWQRAVQDAPAAPVLPAVVITGLSDMLGDLSKLEADDAASALRRAFEKGSPVLAIEATTGLRSAFLETEADIDAFLSAALPRKAGGADVNGAVRLAIRAARDRGCALDVSGFPVTPFASSRLRQTLETAANLTFRDAVPNVPATGYVVGDAPLRRLVPADAPARLLWPVDCALDASALPGKAVVMPPESRWAKAAAIWSAAQAQADAPADRSRRNALIAAARECGVLIPINAWIVVEERSQWLELEKQEDAMLKAGTAFSIKADTPELLLLLLFFLALGALRLRQKRR